MKEVALAQVPYNVVQAELEQKKAGKLIWEFEMVSGEEGARMDVIIDANIGVLLNSEPDGKRGHGRHKSVPLLVNDQGA